MDAINQKYDELMESGQAGAFAEELPRQFQCKSVTLIADLIPLSSSAFYLVGADMLNRGAVLLNLDASTQRDYQRKYRDLDPLNPARFVRSGETLVCIDELLSEQELHATAYYQQFMRPLNHRHVADMFFRAGEDIIAVLSMLRAAALGPFTQAELALARKLQPFLEYALNAVYKPRRYRERQTVQTRFGLTDREVDVLELIASGASNKQIVEQLHVSLATVKTHIQHIFRKFDVPSRTALLATVRHAISG